MFEMAGVSDAVAREALRLASYKLPVRCKIVCKADMEAANAAAVASEAAKEVD